MAETRDLLMDAAEISIRQKGYNAVSFRELADDLGIKSASVHYHFRKKEDLGLALVHRYSTNFFEALETHSKEATTSAQKLSAFCETYKQALLSSDAICLCGILGAESCSLPDALASDVANFFKANLRWLNAALPQDWPIQKREVRAEHILATLQGAMMLATAMKNHKMFDHTVALIQSDLSNA